MAAARAGRERSDEAIRNRFAAIRSRHLRATVALLGSILVVLVLSAFVSVLAPLWAPFLLAYLFFLVIGAAYLRYTWLCPRCRHYLGTGQFLPGWKITHCRSCGVRLR